MCYKIISWNTTGPLRQTTVRTPTQDKQKNSKQSKALVRGTRIYTVELHYKLEEMSGKKPWHLADKAICQRVGIL